MQTKLPIIIFTAIAIGVSAVLSGGCASKKKQATLNSFDDRIRLYGRLLRWKEYEAAVKLIRHQDESEVDVNLGEISNLHVVDYEVKKVTMGEELKTAEVEAEISYYFETSSVVKKIRDTQSWHYIEEAKMWFLDDELPAF